MRARIISKVFAFFRNILGIARKPQPESKESQPADSETDHTDDIYPLW